MNTSIKIVSLESLFEIRENLRQSGKRTVCVSGSFDPLHSGHIAYLEFARNQGDILMVLLNSDVSVRTYKGKGRPLIPETDRARMLAALSCVDYVTLFDDLTPVPPLRRLRPDVFVNGADWGRSCIEKEVVEEGGGTIRIFEGKEADESRRSASALVQKLRQEAPAGQKAIFLDRDGTIIHDTGYPRDPDAVELIEGVPEALIKLQNEGFRLVVVTNQSGVGRGILSEKEATLINARIQKVLEERGVSILTWSACYHIPEDGCECRKPNPTMLVSAASEHDIILNDSWMIGDRESDVMAGRLANVKTILLKSEAERTATVAHIVCASLKEAAEHIIQGTAVPGVLFKA